MNRYIQQFFSLLGTIFKRIIQRIFDLLCARLRNQNPPQPPSPPKEPFSFIEANRRAEEQSASKQSENTLTAQNKRAEDQRRNSQKGLNGQDGQRKRVSRKLPTSRLRPTAIAKVFASTGNGLNDTAHRQQSITLVRKPKGKLLKRSPIKTTRLPVLKQNKEKLKSRQMQNVSFQKI
jgi:hypothetical protein